MTNEGLSGTISMVTQGYAIPCSTVVNKSLLIVRPFFQFLVPVLGGRIVDLFVRFAVAFGVDPVLRAQPPAVLLPDGKNY